MRKLTLLCALSGLLFTAKAANAQGYGMAGCGLGALIFGNDNSTLMQLLAATANVDQISGKHCARASARW